MRSLRNDAGVILLALAFYGSYAWDQFRPPVTATAFTFPFGLALVSLLGLLLMLRGRPRDRWVYLIAAFVPLEISGPRWIFPSLSPIDYLCGAALVDWMSRSGVRGMLRGVRDNLGKAAVIAWLAFYAFGLWDASHSGGSIRGLLRWGEFLFCFILAVTAVAESPDPQTKLASLLSWCSALFSLVAIFQFYSSHGDYTVTFATFQQHNGFGAYLSLCLPAAWGLAMAGPSKHRAPRILLAAIITIAFLLAYSRGAWMGMAVASFAVILAYANRFRGTAQTRRRLAFISAVVFMGMSVLIPLGLIHKYPELGVMHWTPGTPQMGPRMPPPPSVPRFWRSAERPFYWRAAYLMIQKHPWRGIGPGRFPAALLENLEADALKLHVYELQQKHHADFWSHLHSMYLQVLVEYGGIGFCLWIIALASLIVPRLASIQTDQAILPLCFRVSVMAFFIHNTVDILFVNSLDLLMVFLLVFSA